MKNIFRIVAMLLLTFNFGLLTVQAQVPNAINFQAIARDADGEVMANTTIMIQLTILDGSATGTNVYQEIRSLTTNGYGSFSFQIGIDPYMNVGDFDAIEWETGDKFMKVDYDPTASLQFDLTLGTIEFATVPYAFAAGAVSYIDLSGVQDGDVLLYNSATGKFEPGQVTGGTVEWSNIVNVPNFATVATSGDYTDLLNLPSLFDGQYSSLTGTPAIPTDLNELTDIDNLLQGGFSGSYNDLTDLPTLFDGNYNSLTNLPTLFSGNYNDLTNKPDFTGWDTDASDDFDGDWSSLTGKPAIPTDLNELTDIDNLLQGGFSGSYNDLTDLPTLFDGNYNSLSNLPTLFSGNYNDLTNQPTLFDGAYGSLTGTPTTITGYGITDAFSGSYTDLTDKPENATTSAAGFMSSADKTKLDGIATGAEVNVNADWNATTGDAQITNKPTLSTVATSGSYNDLTNKPTITDDQTLTEVLTQNNSAGNANITNLADPVSAKDAANKDYVDALEAQVEIMQNSLIAGGLMVKDYDGNVYGIVEIGAQVWMSENLKVTHYPDGTAIPHITDNTAWANLGNNDTDDAYCFYDNNSSSAYGALYTWAAAMGDNAVSSSTNPSGVQGVCPDGWHLPSDDEWTELTDYLGGTNVAGGKMKEIGTTHWSSPNTGATNESGFSALPGGSRGKYDGTLDYLGYLGYWWSATEVSGATAWGRYLYYNSAEAYRYFGSKSLGFSVRCVRD